MMKTTLVALLVGAAATFGVVTAGSAHADPAADPDGTSYLVNLARYSISYANEADALAQGNAICDRFRGGDSFAQVTDTVKASGHSDFDSGVIVGAATEFLCPDQMSKARGTADLDW